MERGARVLLGRAVQAVDGRGVQLTGGAWRSAGQVVVAAGLGSRALLRPLLGVVPLAPRKGHLAVTARGPALCRHQLVEASYLDSVHGESGCSVAMNIQPRPGGQLLVGSSRQRGVSDLEVEPALLGRMLARACDFMPSLAERSVLRAWCGLRPATPDGLPLIGPVPSCHGLWLAAGHEGLGITTSLATAELITDQMLGRRGALDPAPYCLGRFEGREVA